MTLAAPFAMLTSAKPARTDLLPAVRLGEVLVAHEERPHVLVSETHVRKNWNAEQQRWFREYAYPLTDEVFVSGSKP